MRFKKVESDIEKQMELGGRGQHHYFHHENALDEPVFLILGIFTKKMINQKGLKL